MSKRCQAQNRLKEKKVFGWDRAIADAKMRIKKLEFSVRVFRQRKKAGDMWVDESATHNYGKCLESGSHSDLSIGYCLKCGIRISRCGEPFSLEITCQRCGAINQFEESQQPKSFRFESATHN